MPDKPSVEVESVATGPLGANTPALLCRHCQSPVAEGATVCEHCGRKPYRTCFCGAPVVTGVERCPICDADWSSAQKLRRRSRSKHVRPRTLLRSALTGALLTVLIAALLNIIVTAMAERSIPVGAHALTLGARLYYAWCTLYAALNTLFTRLLGGLGMVAITAVAGAGLGVLLYLLRSGYWRPSRHRSTHLPSRRRRSR